MFKFLILSFSFSIIFTGCFSASSLNPFNIFSQKEQISKKDAIIPPNAPSWLINPKRKNYISAIGHVSIKEEVGVFDKQRALLNASDKLNKEVYKKTINYYKNYEKTLTNPLVFDKDIQKIAKQISLEAISKSKITNSWLSDNNILFVRISIDSDFIATLIQDKSKKIYKIDQNLYKNILSNRAKALLIEYLEN